MTQQNRNGMRPPETGQGPIKRTQCVQQSVQKRVRQWGGTSPAPLACGLILVLGACAPQTPAETGSFGVGRLSPPGAAKGTCWEREIVPARIETITEQVALSPAELGPAGEVLKPAIYATQTRQEIVSPRQESFFQVLCPKELDASFVSSLQRALKARGFYAADITGLMDPDTHAAVQAYQRSLGERRDGVSLAAARKLGLRAIQAPS